MKNEHPLTSKVVRLKSLNSDLMSKEIFILGYWRGEINSENDIDRVKINNLNIGYNIRMIKGQVPISEKDVLYGRTTKTGKFVLFHDCEIDRIVSY